MAAAATLYLSDHRGASPANVATALTALGNRRAKSDRDATKEPLLSVDPLLGKTIEDGADARRRRGLS